jgi:glutamate-1-semialdehyde 2,1-aminomutase
MLMTPAEVATVKQQAAAEYPNECCGVILTRGAERRIIPCRNVQDQMHARDPITFPRTAKNAYYMDPIDALKLNRLVDQGYEFSVIYHSHPNAGAYFSETDRAQALIRGEPAYPSAAYVVVSVIGGEVKSLAAFRFNRVSAAFERIDAGDLDPSPEAAETAGSRRLLAEAERRIPGGVNSPVRAYRSVGGEPRFIARGQGARVWDVDGREYLDFVASWGPLILGHAPPAVVEALAVAASRGTSYGAPTGQEVELAAMITAAYPSMEMVRLVSSGTEAAMSAIRLARGATGRDLLVKFDGCYHGHADSLLVKAGSGGATFGIPDSRGVPAALAELTLTLPFNDLGAVRELFRTRGSEIAALIVEPVAGNMGVVPPAPGFLGGLREITAASRTLLIFDEVITGFRVAYGGAQELYGVRPDLTCLGKIIGGGLPVGAYGGSRAIMEHVAPLGGVYQAGTLSGNPLAVAAGVTTLRALEDRKVYGRLEGLGARLERGFAEAAEKAGVPLTINRVGSMLTAFFCAGPVRDYAGARTADTARYARFFHAMLERGVALAPSQFEAAFVSLAHSEGDIDLAGRVAAQAMETLA